MFIVASMLLCNYYAQDKLIWTIIAFLLGPWAVVAFLLLGTMDEKGSFGL